MSTLEKTINLLSALPENQIETIYSFVQFLSSQRTVERPGRLTPAAWIDLSLDMEKNE